MLINFINGNAEVYLKFTLKFMTVLRHCVNSMRAKCRIHQLPTRSVYQLSTKLRKNTFAINHVRSMSDTFLIKISKVRIINYYECSEHFCDSFANASLRV